MNVEPKATNDRAAVFRTTGVKPGTLFALPKARNPQSAAASGNLVEALAGLGAHDLEMTMRRDSARTDADHAALNAFDLAGRAAVREKIAAAETAAQADQAEFASDRAGLLGVPATPDQKAATLDGEWRARFRAMTPVQQDAHRAAMKSGQNDTLLHALGRDIFDDEHSVYAKALWADRMRREHAATLAQLDARDEGVQEVLTGCGALRRLIA